MVMKEIIENFKRSMSEVTQLPDFRFEAMMVNKTSKERGKEDILSDIRSLPGVTIVAVREAEKRRPGEDYSILSLKVDRLVLGHASTPTIIKDLRHKINRLDGVLSFAIRGIPEQL